MFLNKPKNATFLFIAISLEYIQIDFKDYSLLDFLGKKTNWWPANRVETTVYFSSRFDFGGLVYKSKRN
jgi:hypothetical protein